MGPRAICPVSITPRPGAVNYEPHVARTLVALREHMARLLWPSVSLKRPAVRQGLKAEMKRQIGAAGLRGSGAHLEGLERLLAEV